MTRRLIVTWQHHDTLLPERLFEVSLDGFVGGEVKRVRSQPGLREFVVDPVATLLTLTVRARAPFRAMGAVPPTTATTLSLKQEIDVSSGELRFRPSPQWGAHPRLSLRQAASREHLIATLAIDTTFLDVTSVYASYAHERDLDSFAERAAESKTNFAAFAYTGGSPLLWFASIPAKCRGTSPVSALVFFRPSGDAYSRVDEGHSLYRLNRYLLQPVAAHAQASPRQKDHFAYEDSPKNESIHAFVRAGFENALEQSRKSVVMVHPWPNGLSYGDAIGAGLPSLVKRFTRALWAEGRLAFERSRLVHRRLGLAGYSSGGEALWTAWRNNRSRVDEVYSFDTVAIPPTASVLDWVSAHPGRMLRMTRTGRAGSRAASIAAAARSARLSDRVTVFPEAPNGYDRGESVLWDRTLSSLDNDDLRSLQNEPGWQHHFALFGGVAESRRVSLSDPDAPTFLRLFLEASSL